MAAKQLADQNSQSNIDSQNTEYLRQITGGFNIIGTKEFNLIFLITNFLPFIRPRFPMITKGEITMRKAEMLDKKKRAIVRGNK